ncbi:GNAT family N-acetyltransferase [Halorarum salinum]|uniref:GNAT family N-acetyltransferase n=1 Tax=Halorarum salinum TaxID=2743089 RepID=A0A7D5LA21_9EURY|nr:GNAT family protein [Halobaculum salinum]QLG61507.1 GNAT family N-acetyltransferase [Halobaculum salinum]
MPGPTFLSGDRTTLHPATEDDLPFLLENENDERVRRTRSGALPTAAGEFRPRLGGTTGRSDDTLVLLVVADGDPVGLVYLIRERPNDDTFRRAELAYWIAPDEWGNGYATDASRAVLAHGFDAIGLHKVTATAFEHNPASRRVLEKAGFEGEGVHRAEAYVDGEWRDIHRYGLLAGEFDG